MVCQSHKGNDLHPSRRLVEYGACRSRQGGLSALKVGSATSKTANYRGVSMNMAPSTVAGFSVQKNGGSEGELNRRSGTSLEPPRVALKKATYSV